MRPIDADNLHMEISKWPESVMYKDWVQSAIVNAPTIEIDISNNPLTMDELREIEGKPIPVWCDKVNGYVFIATTKTEPYNQVWFFNHKGCADTILYYHTDFYLRNPKR